MKRKVKLSLIALGLLSLVDINDDMDVPETGSTFEENAVIKAEAWFKKTGIITIADDSGLEVDALGGAPGVRSARYAGETADDAQNNKKLLNKLKDTPLEKRIARFRCVMALAMFDGTKTFDGVVEGRLALEPAGTSGFGYDPLFIPDGYDKTFAELGADVKNSLSHRARALEKVVKFLSGGN